MQERCITDHLKHLSDRMSNEGLKSRKYKAWLEQSHRYGERQWILLFTASYRAMRSR